MARTYLRKYGVQTTIDFELFAIDGVDLKADAAHASGDITLSKDEGNFATATNGFTDEGITYSLVLTATEMQAARIVIGVVDQGTKAWLDTVLIIETYGNASAMYKADFDDTVRLGLTALPNAAADAAGGLPISDAGGLDLDALNTNVSRLGYSDGLWYDNANGTAGSTFGTHGKMLAPTTEEASIVTLQSSSGLDNVYCVPGSAYVLASTYVGKTFIGLGAGCTMALGGQVISGLTFVGFEISGVGTGTGATFVNCTFAAATIPPGSVLQDCVLSNTLTLGDDGNYDIAGLRTQAGSTALIDLVNCNSTTVINITDFNGPLTIDNGGASNTVNIDGSGALTLPTGQTGLTVNAYGSVEPSNVDATVNDFTAPTILNTIDGKLDTSLNHTDGIDTISTNIDTLTGDVAAVQSTVDGIDTAVGALDTALAVVDGIVDGIVVTLNGAPIRRNTALANFPFSMLADDGSPGLGLTVTAERSLDGAAFAACANAVSEITDSGSGYKISLAASDLDAKTVALRFTASGAQPLNLTLVTQGAAS